MRSKRIRSPIQHVYFIQSQEFVKIGWATDMKTRMVNCQMNNPHQVELLATMRGGLDQEKMLHGFFREHRHRGEWFVYAEPIRELVDLIRGMEPVEARIAAGDWFFKKTGYGSFRLDWRDAAAMEAAELHAANVR